MIEDNKRITLWAVVDGVAGGGLADVIVSVSTVGGHPLLIAVHVGTGGSVGPVGGRASHPGGVVAEGTTVAPHPLAVDGVVGQADEEGGAGR